MLRVLWEIIIPLILAFFIGLLVGYLFWRWRRTQKTAAEWTAMTNSVDASRSEVIDLRTRHEASENALVAARTSLDQRTEALASAQSEAARLTTLQRESLASLDEVEQRLSDRDVAIADRDRTITQQDQTIARFEADLAACRNDLEDERRSATAGDTGVATLHAVVSAGDQELTPDWVVGTTKLGTFGAEHSDDLKVISGVGPKMESVLNDFGITAWEQVAALTEDEVETLTEAIDTFPGRIARDNWVGQAGDLVARFPDQGNRPTRETFLNNDKDDDPWN